MHLCVYKSVKSKWRTLEVELALVPRLLINEMLWDSAFERILKVESLIVYKRQDFPNYIARSERNLRRRVVLLKGDWEYA